MDALNAEVMMDFDYMRESTALIIQMMRESLREGETLPSWASEPISSREIFRLQMDGIRKTLSNLLRLEYMAKTDPPPPNFWYMRQSDNQIIVGVENARDTLAEGIYPEEAILREFSLGTGNVVVMDAGALVAFMRRDGGEFGNWSVPKRGLISTVKRMVGR